MSSKLGSLLAIVVLPVIMTTKTPRGNGLTRLSVEHFLRGLRGETNGKGEATTSAAALRSHSP